MLRYTDHFIENWRNRMGGEPPPPERLQELLENAVILQRARAVYRRRGGRFERYNLLAIYWHPGIGCVVKVDERTNAVVTCLSRRNAYERRL